VDPPPVPSGPAGATVTDGVAGIAFAPDHDQSRRADRARGYLRDAPKVQIRGATGTASASLVGLESLEVGGARVGPLRVTSHDAQMGRGAHGLLGRDFLNHFRVTVDNARGVVELAPR
jgi:predicted aspartyl protease